MKSLSVHYYYYYIREEKKRKIYKRVRIEENKIIVTSDYNQEKERSTLHSQYVSRLCFNFA